MKKFEALFKASKINCVYLLDRETFIDSLITPLRETFPFEACSVTGFSSAGFDFRGIFCGYPPEYLRIYANKHHERLPFYKDHLKAAARMGFDTKIINHCARTYPTDYAERYEPFGFQCGTQTVFYDRSGNPIGVTSMLKKSAPRFTPEEERAVTKLPPYLMYAFLRYRYLVALDFFTLVSFDEFPIGILTCNAQGTITYMNECVTKLFKQDSLRDIPSRLPTPFMDCKHALDAISGSGPVDTADLFQNTETYIAPYGMVICYRFDDKYGGNYLPSKKGYVFFIDTKKKTALVKGHLSKREFEVIRLVGLGLQDKEIANEIGISEKTVQIHLHNVFKKLETNNRTEAAVRAIRLGLI